MKLINVLKTIKELEVPIFRTSDISVYLNIEMSHASKLLRRLTDSEQLIHIKKGLWAIPDKVDPLALPNYILSPLPAYISFHSALYYHNVIDQIPEVIYVATLHKTEKFITPIATISAHQIQPKLFFGYVFDEKTGIKMATAEKAFFDILYLSLAKSGIFKSLPEIDKEEIDLDEVLKFIKKIPSKSRQTSALKLFKSLI